VSNWYLPSTADARYVSSLQAGSAKPAGCCVQPNRCLAALVASWPGPGCPGHQAVDLGSRSFSSLPQASKGVPRPLLDELRAGGT
jgi:hypothetical protein